ncbi:MAG TPA: cytochrome d ubiquinol oxidase subunit II [Burkholderiales bacterium]|nr:cytochrome d ubiquinol oxidase subunit II [Burkholderiales bacterium]
MDNALPVIFMALMGLSMLIYVVLDGYDLGVGIWLKWSTDDEKDLMISSIGPFWDANETWLVLGAGILLIAFPMAHGVILTALYLPVAMMLFGLVMRGVAFDFRVKAKDEHKPLWNTTFFAGSLIASLAQGWMLGKYIMGLRAGWVFDVFSLLIALCLAAAYMLIGASWLIMKAEAELQRKAARWARRMLPIVAFGILVISLATPFVSKTIFDRWFELPGLILLLPIPLTTAAILVALWMLLKTESVLSDRWCWTPFAMTTALFILCAFGLAYSLFPYVIPDRMTAWDAASSAAALKVILVGVVVTVPAIAGYSIFAYRVFRGKARTLTYG